MSFANTVEQVAFSSCRGKLPAGEMRRDLLGVEWQYRQFGRRTANEPVEEQQVFGLLGVWGA